MKISQLKSIHHWVRSTNTSEIVFVSALILPFYLLMWNSTLNQFDNIDTAARSIFTIVALAMYAGGIIWMKVSQSKDERSLRDLMIIKNYLLDKQYDFISFERITKLNSNLTEDRARALLLAFPDEFRFAKLKGDKQGIKLLKLDVEIEKPD